MTLNDIEKAPNKHPNEMPTSTLNNRSEIATPSLPALYPDSSLNSLSGTLYNLVKTSIGCGMIFLPTAMHDCGIVFGIVLIAFSGIVTLIPQILLSHMSILGVSDYISLSRKCYGKGVETSIVLFQLLLLFTPMIAYIKLNGLFASNFLMHMGLRSDSIFVNPTLLTVLLSFFVILPLCLLKNLSKLSFASVMGLICVTYLSLLTILDYFYDSWINNGLIGISPGLGLIVAKIKYYGFGLPLMSAFNTFMLAYTNHPSILPLISEMKNPNTARRSKLIYTSQFIVFIFYLLTTTFGYLHFGASCERPTSYIMIKHTPFYFLAQLLLVFVNIITFPLIHWPARLSLDWLLRELIKIVDKKTLGKKPSVTNIGSFSPVPISAKNLHSIEEKFDEAKNVRHVLEAVILVSICCIFAIIFPSILSVFDFFVPISGSFILFTIPSVCYLKCVDKGFVERKLSNRVLAYIGLIIGLLHFSVGSVYAVCTYIIWT